MRRTLPAVLALPVLLTAAVAPASAATLVASYDFQTTLAANEAGAPALTAIDPLGQNAFETAVVNGQSRTVYSWKGNGQSALDQAGLKLDATGLVNYGSYSVAMTFEFTQNPPFGGGWTRILDTQNRTSDAGLYTSPDYQGTVVQAVDRAPGGDLIVFGKTAFTRPGFHDLVMSYDTVNGQGVVKTWLDGKLELTANFSMFALDNPNNTGHLLHFFADNLQDQAGQEFANGRIASLKIYDGVYAPVPEPGEVALLLAGLGVLGLWTRRRARRV